MSERSFILALLFAAGCATESEAPGALSGRWVSTISSEFLGLTLDVQGNTLRGEAELMPDAARVQYSLEGRAAGDSVNATLRSTDGENIVLRAELRRDTLHVRLTGGRWNDRAVPLVKNSP